LKKLVPVFITGILALTACGASDSNASSDAFESAQELVDAINANTDLTCSSDISDTQGSLDSEESWDSMHCDDKGIAHYLKSDGAKAFLLDWLEENGTSKTRVALGDNWIFVGYHHKDAHAVRKALDGVQPSFSSGLPSPSEQETAREEPKAEGESESQGLREVASDELSISDLADSSEEQTLDELVESWEYVTGETCDLEPAESDSFGSSGVNCDSASVLAIYESTTGLRQQLKSADELYQMAEMEGSRLVGINWGMTVDSDLIEDLHAELGGIRVDLGS